MGNRERTTDPTICTHCHLCQENCLFLEKYKLDIGDTERLNELLYHCFLCGKCTEVCPMGIDGRAVILEMRQKQVEGNAGKVKEKGYQMLIQEKKNYIFKNYQDTAKSVLFPGCNFPSYFPKTTKYLAKLLKEKAGIGTVFDCCGKPIAELGMKDEEERIIEEMEKTFAKNQIEELIMVCPNCYDFLKPRLKTVRIVSIYEKLWELGIGEVIEEKLTIFPPCPDRKSGEILEQIRPFLKEEPDMIREAQCCGLGGCAGGKESDLAEKMAEKVKERGQHICTYCASCSGSFARKGFTETEHILLKILGIEEQPDTAKSMVNRAKTKYWRG